MDNTPPEARRDEQQEVHCFKRPARAELGKQLTDEFAAQARRYAHLRIGC